VRVLLILISPQTPKPSARRQTRGMTPAPAPAGSPVTSNENTTADEPMSAAAPVSAPPAEAENPTVMATPSRRKSRKAAQTPAAVTVDEPMSAVPVMPVTAQATSHMTVDVMQVFEHAGLL